MSKTYIVETDEKSGWDNNSRKLRVTVDDDVSLEVSNYKGATLATFTKPSPTERFETDVVYAVNFACSVTLIGSVLIEEYNYAEESDASKKARVKCAELEKNIEWENIKGEGRLKKEWKPVTFDE